MQYIYRVVCRENSSEKSKNECDKPKTLTVCLNIPIPTAAAQSRGKWETALLLKKSL
jgi:hypothetical protein